MDKVVIDETKLPKVMEIIKQAASIMEEKDYVNDEEVKQEFERLQNDLQDITENNKIDITDFREYWGYTDLETVARKALMSPPQKINITDNEIREIVLSILDFEEAEMDYWLEYLEVNTGLDNLTDYIFYPDLIGLDGDASLEEIAEKIITDKYKANERKNKLKNSIEKDCCFEYDGFWFRYRSTAIIIEEDCVLMCYNDKEDYYYSVGGGVHMGESSRDAVIREVKEETGIEYDVERLAFVNECMYHGDGSLRGKECHVLEFYYLMKSKGNKFIVNGAADGTDECLKWVPLEKIKNNPKVFPVFYREKLSDFPKELMHIVQEERED